MTDIALIRENLIKRAETVLRPSLAILIECAFEAERSEKAAEFLDGLIGRFYTCAKQAVPLKDGKYRIFDILLPSGKEEVLGLGLVSADTEIAETVLSCGMSPGDDGFVEYVSKLALSLELSKFAPMILGIGISDDEGEARFLARKALFRSPDRHSDNPVTAECERRILAAVNREGPGAGGLGGSHTALAVSIEQTGKNYIVLCPGDYFTRFASEKL